MNSGLFPPLAAFLITALAITLLRPLALRIGLTDKPGYRKKHSGEIPLIGGIAVFIGASAAMFIGAGTGLIAATMTALLSWFFASLLLVCVGAYDDYADLSPLLRLAAEVAAVLLMIFGAGNVLTNLGWISPGENFVELGRWAVPFTVFAAVGIINAFNMCDGLDGLSGNLALVTLLAFGIADSMWGDLTLIAATNVISAAIAGFLLFNQRLIWRNKAEVFLGDAGSMMLGLALAWGAIDLSQGNARAISPAAMLWLLMVPVFDTVRVMLRRILHGGSPFRADAYHLHHLLMRAGCTVTETIALICVIAVIGAIIGLVGHGLRLPEFLLAALYTGCGVVYYIVIERAWSKGSLLGKKLAPP